MINDIENGFDAASEVIQKGIQLIGPNSGGKRSVR